MRLKEIKVKKLFEVFDHTIPLNLKDRITIIHGLNGYGKTTLLLLVQAIIQGHFSRLRKVSFSELILIFENGQELCIKRTKTNENDIQTDLQVKLVFELTDGVKPPLKHVIESHKSTMRINIPLQFIAQHVDNLEQIGPDTWLDVSSGRQIDLEEVIEIYGDFIPTNGRKPAQKIPEWLQLFTKDFEVRLIAAQRLLNVGSSKRVRNVPTALPIQPSVQIYAQELATRIQQVQAQYGAKSQDLDSSFARRAIEENASTTIESTELECKLQLLDERRKGIIAAGLLPADHKVAEIRFARIQDSVKGILALHASDVEKKLGVFDEIVAKVDLLKELVNRRFTFKKLEVDTKMGFRLISNSGNVLQSTDLSSGEQHELVLFYELLFRTEKNTLILIDEPELSLHVSWQSEFLKDLEKVVQLSSLDVVLATHSPQIIANRWDLTVELAAPVS